MAFGFVLIPAPSLLCFWHGAKNIAEKGTRFQSSSSLKAIQTTKLEAKFANLAELVERGQGFFSHSFSEG